MTFKYELAKQIRSCSLNKYMLYTNMTFYDEIFFMTKYGLFYYSVPNITFLLPIMIFYDQTALVIAAKYC